MEILASKNGHKKKFSQLAWDNLGENKNGWEIVEDAGHVVTNEVETPPTGQTDTAPVVNQIVTNEAAPKPEAQIVTNEVETPPTVSEVVETEKTEDSADEFYELAKANLKRNTIKDFLDINQVEYKQNDTLDTLIESLRGNLKGDIELLKLNFGL